MAEFCPKCNSVHPEGVACEADEVLATQAPLTRKQLDPDRPTEAFVANVHAPCHRGRPLKARYGNGILVLSCAKCGQDVAHFKVASE